MESTVIKGILFQESLYIEPFWMLVACCLVNLTKWQQAEPVFEMIHAKYPTIEALSELGERDLYNLVQPLGFGNRRAKSIPVLAATYMVHPPKVASDVMNLPGCGQYAHDSWAIFVDGRRDVVPTDRELLAWLERNQ